MFTTSDYFMQKWNLDKGKYQEYFIPESNGWHCPIYCNDMDEPINCTECGKKITFGDAYTSHLIHNKVGFGYPICYDCKETEYKLEQEHLNKLKSDHE